MVKIREGVLDRPISLCLTLTPSTTEPLSIRGDPAMDAHSDGRNSAGASPAFIPVIQPPARGASGASSLSQSTKPTSHFRRPEERPFTRAERDRVTLLFGGLTMRHESLLLAALRGLGYRVALIPTPCKADFQAGKEYGNNGQCNPTY